MKKDLSMEARLLIAFVLMGLVLFLTPYIYKPATAPAAGANKPATSMTTDAKEASTPPPEAPAPAPPVTPAAAVEMPGQIHADKEETVDVDTDLYHIVFSNKGAVVKGWVLKDFKDHDGKSLDLVNPAAMGKVPAPFSLEFRSQKPTTDPNAALYKVDRDGDNLTFEFSDGRMDVKKTFQFAKDSYLSRVTSQVSQNGVMLPHELQWRGGFGDETITNPAAAQHGLLYDPNAPRKWGVFSDELQKKDASLAKNGPVTSSGQYTFAGVEDAYFTGVFIPTGASSLELTTYSDQIPKDSKDSKEVATVGAAIGGEGLNSFELYMGPKDLEILKRVNPKLELVVDWGKFAIIAKPLFEALKWTAGKVGGNYGWAIILVTIAINTVLFPLKITSMKSSKKMQSIQPQIAAINAKYKGLSLNDPKKADQNQEIMALYKENGVNPAGGCLPMLLQLPFFFAFYAVLGVAIQLRGAHWLWVTDLSQQESLAIHVLPLILIATQFLTQRMTPSPGMDPSQQKMMMVMPLVLGYMFYFASSGLVIYWLTGNVVGVAQQWFLNRGTPKPQPKVVDVKPVPKKKEIMPHKKFTVADDGPRIDKFLKHVFTLAGFKLDFTVAEGETPHPDFENPDLMIRFTGPDVDLLLENKTELLLALEHLTMEALGMAGEEHSRICFDANDRRILRIEELRMSALAAAERVKKSHAPFHFSPMNSRERRILHLALRGETDVRSESVGEGPIRQVVVVPADLKVLPEPIRPPRPRPEDDGGMRGRGDRRGGPPGRGGPRGGFGGGRDRGPRR